MIVMVIAGYLYILKYFLSFLFFLFVIFLYSFFSSSLLLLMYTKSQWCHVESMCTNSERVNNVNSSFFQIRSCFYGVLFSIGESWLSVHAPSSATPCLTFTYTHIHIGSSPVKPVCRWFYWATSLEQKEVVSLPPSRLFPGITQSQKTCFIFMLNFTVYVIFTLPIM